MVRSIAPPQTRAPSGVVVRLSQRFNNHHHRNPRARHTREQSRCPDLVAQQRASFCVAHAASLQTDVQNAGPQPEAPPPKPVEVDAKLVQLEGSTTMIQCFCRTHLRYEAEYGLKRGTTTNCYLLEDGEGSLLIDVPRAEYLDVFLREVRKLEKKVHTVVLTHLNPDIVETLTQTLQIVRKPPSKVVLVLSNPALQVLQSRLEASEEGQELMQSLEIKVPKTEAEVEVGRRVLKCIPASTPRYPDMLCVYERTTRRLFSSCLFSAHVNPQLGVVGTDGMDRGGWEAYGNDWQFFFDCMFAPVAKPTLAALNKLNIAAATANNNTPLLVQLARFFTGAKPSEGGGNPMPVKMIFPRHGPIVRQSVTQLVGQYNKWVERQIKVGQSAKVAVLYASAYGNTAALAQAISRGITKANVGVEMINLETLPMRECEQILEESQGFVIGSPTLGGHMPTQVSAMLGSIMRSKTAMTLPCGVFGSFGWSGESVDILSSKLKDAGFQAAFAPIKVQFRPDAKALQICEESGTDLAQLILKRKRQSAKSTSENASAATRSSATGAQAAMGRVVGSLSVVTTKDEEAESAMLASWIAQASFKPPGLTVAVKKDRATESLLVLNNKFNVNVLAEGREKAIMKAVLKPFKPGEFRFNDVEHERSEGTGCVVLKDAAAVLECTVTNRLDAGDHWIVYGTIDNGQVLDEGSVSSVHHRKDGTSY